MTTAALTADSAALQRELRAHRRRRRPSGWHLVLIPVAAVMLFPFFWLIMTSFSTLAETRTFPPQLPHSIQWHNYVDAWQTAPFARWLFNTSLVSLIVVIGNLVISTLAGYALARIRFLGNGALFLVILATVMVPFQVIMIPVMLICRELGLIDTLGALVAPNLATAFGIFLMRQFFKTMPIEIEEAARIDGAGRLGTLVKVVVPSMSAPLATLAIVTLLNVWNDFLWPLIAIQSEPNMTLQLGLMTFQGAHLTNWPVLMAGTVTSQIPMLVAFVLAQRWFVRSLASSGLKG